MRIACGSEELERPLSRFPLRGKAGAGGFPPRHWHAARQPKALSRIDAAAPPTRGAAAPLCIPRWLLSVDALYDVNRTFHLLIKPDNLTCYQHGRSRHRETQLLGIFGLSGQ
jgi:hypothetical protein